MGVYRRFGVSGLAGLLCVSASAWAGTIDSVTGQTLNNLSSGAAPFWTHAQTFQADDVNLSSFAWYLQDEGTDNYTVEFLVFSTVADANHTPLAQIWSSIDDGGQPALAVGSSAGLYFPQVSPNIGLAVGTWYAIGVRRLSGDNVDSPFNVLSDVIPGGGFWDVYGADDLVPGNGPNGGGPFGGQDAAVLIVMNPEPGTFGLFGLGLLGAAGVVVRRRRARRAFSGA